MDYHRVIPRDLFNEASLLKCYGHLWLLLDQKQGHVAHLCDEDDCDISAGFKIAQNENTGGITIANVPFTIRGEEFLLERPLNSRDDWPLYCINLETDEAVSVFDDRGELSSEFWDLISCGRQ